mgnify:CR=1 FL=1
MDSELDPTCTYSTVEVKNCESTNMKTNKSMPAMRGNKHKNAKPDVKSSSPKKFHSKRTLIEGSTPSTASTSIILLIYDATYDINTYKLLWI